MAEDILYGSYDDVRDPLFTDPLTRDEVAAHMRAAVDAYGADYCDPVGLGHVPELDECQYLYDDGRRCIVGEVVWRARGVQIPANAGSAYVLMENEVVPVAGDEVMDLLRKAQGLQDDGKPWGTVFHALKLQEASE